MSHQGGTLLPRREFFSRAARYSALALSLPALLEACARESDVTPSGNGTGTATARSLKDRQKAVQDQAQKMVGDVTDFQLTSDDWEGVFGFAKFRMHKGTFDGSDVYYIRTDTSDQAYADSEKLVFVPKLAPLKSDGLAGSVYLFPDGGDQGAVFSSQPGRDDYSPVWKVRRVTWKGTPTSLKSAADVQAAERRGDIGVESTDIILNAAMVKWAGGELAVDSELKAYLGGGQLIEAPDTSAMTVTFKLHECFPETRYIVTDHSITMAAEMTKTIFAPGLQQKVTAAGATGRTNVFMNGVEGTGPMGFQPSAFDFAVGDPNWSPYWDHFTYAWKDGVTPRLLETETEIHRARDDGELDEFPGTPDTNGEIFTVNCPSPVKAPNVFTA